MTESIPTIASLLNEPGANGPRLMAVAGEIITEIEAIYLLFGADATLIASGGISGAEGSIWLGVSGGNKEKELKNSLEQIILEKPFII